MDISGTIDLVCAAILPVQSLPALGPLRAYPGLRATVVDQVVFLRWNPGVEEILRILLAQPGVELFESRQNLWYRPGSSLPTFQVTEALNNSPFHSLDRILTPGPIEPKLPTRISFGPVPIRLVLDTTPRPARALMTRLEALAVWADRAPSAEFTGLSAAWDGSEVLILGHPLPAIPHARRFHGEHVLLPLGWRCEPPLTEDALRSALGVDPSQLLLLESAGAETIPRSAFEPLSRSSIRLATEARDP